jgi:1-pyrroline-5-carboxylate dehydrogenase
MGPQRRDDLVVGQRLRHAPDDGLGRPERVDHGLLGGVDGCCGWNSSGSTGKGGLGPYYLTHLMREQSRTVVG